MVMTENSTVQQGLAGIPSLLTKDSFSGYDESHGRTETRRTYRPLSFITFAVEKQFFDNNPRVSHAVNVLLYAATVVVVFLLLRRLLSETNTHQTQYSQALPVIAALLFLAHPIHTEVVANVKSRDEILALLMGASSLLVLWIYRRSNALLHYVCSIILFALALLAKESVLPFVVIIPLALYFFGSSSSKETSGSQVIPNILRLSVPYFIVASIYAIVWFGLVGRVEERLYESVLGNPFAGASISERYATATAILSLYLAKAFYPTTLSIGYSYNQIPLQNWVSWQALLGLGILVSGIAGAVILGRKRHILSFCVLFFGCMLAVPSNFFVYAGGLLGERFLFTPSLAVVLTIAWLLGWLGTRIGNQVAILWGGCAVIFALYAGQTLSRTADWKSDYTLMRADVASTPRSFNMQQGYAKETLRRVPTEMNPLLRASMLDSARIHLRNALEIYPLGEAETFSTLATYFDLAQSYDSAAFYAEKALQMAPQSQVYRKNISVIHSNKGVDFAQAGNFSEAVNCFRRAFILDSANAVLCGNIGGAFAAMNERDSAMKYLQRAVILDPMNPSARENLTRLQQQGK